MTSKPIYVTEPYLPPLKEFIPYLEDIWSSRQLTNAGVMHQRLEKELALYFDVPEVALFNNGTNALLVALQVLGLRGEVITTPYSFVATSNAIIWNGLKPVFVDIDPYTLNIDSNKIEAAITDKTSAIMPVHCYGNSCDVENIQKIADKYKLKIIYDAAHAFGVEDNGGSILRHGDLSVLSFHATKVFNTFEGGAIVCKDANMKARIDLLKNFGISDEVSVLDVGINGKMSEINAAFGLLQLNYMPDILRQREIIDRKYREELRNIKGISLIESDNSIKKNYSYFPILVEEEFPINRDELYEKFRAENIYARRYFYPLITDFEAYKSFQTSVTQDLSVAKDITQKILCLPIFPSLGDGVSKVIGIIKDFK